MHGGAPFRSRRRRRPTLPSPVFIGEIVTAFLAATKVILEIRAEIHFPLRPMFVYSPALPASAPARLRLMTARPKAGG